MVKETPCGACWSFNRLCEVANYANFLADQREDYKQAEEHYLKALAAAPTEANILHNFAVFLQTRPKTLYEPRSIT